MTMKMVDLFFPRNEPEIVTVVTFASSLRTESEQCFCMTTNRDSVADI